MSASPPAMLSRTLKRLPTTPAPSTTPLNRRSIPPYVPSLSDAPPTSDTFTLAVPRMPHRSALKNAAAPLAVYGGTSSGPPNVARPFSSSSQRSTTTVPDGVTRFDAREQLVVGTQPVPPPSASGSDISGFSNGRSRSP